LVPVHGHAVGVSLLCRASCGGSGPSRISILQPSCSHLGCARRPGRDRADQNIASRPGIFRNGVCLAEAQPEQRRSTSCLCARFGHDAGLRLSGRLHSRCHQIRDAVIEGFSQFVTSMTAPIASGWSDCRVGFAPTQKRRLARRTPTKTLLETTRSLRRRAAGETAAPQDQSPLRP
jgi:hypothetical protein